MNLNMTRFVFEKKNLSFVYYFLNEYINKKEKKSMEIEKKRKGKERVSR